MTKFDLNLRALKYEQKSKIDSVTIFRETETKEKSTPNKGKKLPFIYRKSSKETRGSYSSSWTAFAGLIRVCIGKISKNAGLIRIRVLFEGGALSSIYGI